jgi:large conductance mechanosensitive channel
MTKRIQGFLDFIREQGVVGFAIGFILGGAVSSVTKSLVTDIVNPVIGLAFGSLESLSEWSFGAVKVGAFVSSLIDFFILAAVVYFVFKGLGLDKLDKKKE